MYDVRRDVMQGSRYDTLVGSRRGNLGGQRGGQSYESVGGHINSIMSLAVVVLVDSADFGRTIHCEPKKRTNMLFFVIIYYKT